MIMRTINIADLQRETIQYIELAEEGDIIFLKDGKPIGILHALTDTDDLFEYHLETHPLFIERIKRARADYSAGKSERLDDIRDELLHLPDPQ